MSVDKNLLLNSKMSHWTITYKDGGISPFYAKCLEESMDMFGKLVKGPEFFMFLAGKQWASTLEARYQRLLKKLNEGEHVTQYCAYVNDNNGCNEKVVDEFGDDMELLRLVAMYADMIFNKGKLDAETRATFDILDTNECNMFQNGRYMTSSLNCGNTVTYLNPDLKALFGLAFLFMDDYFKATKQDK